MINVLCIEDELSVVDYISSLLDNKKYLVKNISDGKQALDFLLSTTEPPDVILLDYILPSLNGLQILKELKAHKKEFTVVFLTIDETLETAIAAMKEGAMDYLTKSTYLKTELNIKVEKAYQMHLERLKKEDYEQRLSMLSHAMEQSPNSVMMTDIHGNIEYVNNQFSLYTGYTFDEVKGKNPRILKAGNYPEGFYKKLWQTITSGRTWKGVFENRKKNGELYYEKATISPVKNKSGKIVSFLGIKEDITELKKAEAALHDKTKEMDRFFTVVVDMLCIIDSTSKEFIRVNKAWENTLGYTMDELINTPYTDFVHPDDAKLTQDSAQVLTNTGQLVNFVNRFRCKDGTYKFIEWSSIANNDGTYYSSARDITERKLKEHALKESEDRFRSIFEMANAGIFFADKTGRIIMVNNAFEKMMEYSSIELYNMDFSQFTHQEDLLQENELLKELVFNEIDHYRIEKRYVTQTSKIIWADLAITVIHDENNDPISYVGVVKDISERKEYELRLENMIASKDKFFSIISHDLRNQFSSLLGLTDIIKEDERKLSEEERKRFISLMQTSGESALAMLEDLLKWSRLQINDMKLVKERISLQKLMDDTLTTAQNQAIIKNIEIICHVGQAGEIYADRQMINTVLRNLVNNALKFTHSGGQITLSAKTIDNYQLISIKDTGVGMTEATIQKLFRIDAKHSTPGTGKEIGTGLGLILCKEFIDKHGGEIQVTSEVGKGSEFVIMLPTSK